VAHPSVLAALSAALAEANAALAHPLELRPDAARPPGEEEVLHG